MLNSNTNFLRIIDRFASKKILVIGDFILDVFLKGTSTRLSPEAPVPVVDISERMVMPGGAANTAYNLKALGAEVSFLSVIGNDEEGDAAIKTLEDCGIESCYILQDKKRKTIVKTRIVSSGHPMLRYDWGTEILIDSAGEDQLINMLQTTYGQYDAIVISDYNKGIITDRILDMLKILQANAPTFIALDSKRLPFFSELKPSFVKPNFEETLKIVSANPGHSNRVDEICACSEELYAHTQANITAVTLDSDGALIFNKHEFVHHETAPHVPSASVAGAGDTFVSAFTLAHICGADIPIAAKIATAASTIAISKQTTSPCFKKELSCYFNLQKKYLDNSEHLQEICQTYHAEGKRIVFTNGCFDILHSGHVAYLHQAKLLGDVLIVAVNTDQSIRRLKGEKRPINPLQDRLEVLSALSAVTHVIAFGDEMDDTPIPVVKVVRPHIFVKGGDYTTDRLPEAATVSELGGEIVFIPLVPDHSTTRIIERIHHEVIEQES
jgi:D-beta-D-heptose 7-phosphate kinase / D-beta-D-heptose 1-phosphate adenosyltransferase